MPRLQEQFGDTEFFFQQDVHLPTFTTMWELIWMKICKTDGLEEEGQLNTHLDLQI